MIDGGWAYDEDGNRDGWVGFPREEPNCGGCADSRMVRAPWWARIVGVRRVRCSTGPIRHRLFVWRWRYLGGWPRPRRRGGGFSDEPPF